MDVLWSMQSAHCEKIEVGVASWDKDYGGRGECLSVRVRYKAEGDRFRHSSPEIAAEALEDVMKAARDSGLLSTQIDWSFARANGWRAAA